jgi:hypothetical protein
VSIFRRIAELGIVVVVDAVVRGSLPQVLLLPLLPPIT